MARRVLAQVDRGVVFLVLFIGCLGLYNLASAARTLESNVHIAQAVFLMVGILVAAVVISVDYRNLEGLATPIFIAVLGLLVATLLVGKTVNGSKRWLPMGFANLQTSDLAKLAVILMVAKTLHLERPGGHGLTLTDIFRPFNLSRPLLVVLAVIAVSVFGDELKPPEFKRIVGERSVTIARLSKAKPVLEVGRAEAAGLRLRVGGIEDRHALITRVESGHYEVEDLDSPAGVYVNGERVERTRALESGDVLRFGLNPRSEIILSAKIQKLQPFLPWLAVLGGLWLFAAFYSQLKRGGFESRDLVAPIDVVVLPCLLVLVQPDLGTTLVIIAIAFSVILYVGLAPVSLLLLGVFSAASAVLAWFFVLRPYQKQRVLSFLDPGRDLAGAGYHQHQSLIAIGSGQLSGKGYKQGTQTQFSFLPEQQTDFIFSVWGEEHGFLGCALLAGLFAALILAFFRIALRAKDQFGALLVVGVAAMFFWHTVVNMLMVLQLAPVVGVPLPLWSYGGSFLVTAMIGVGIALNVGARRYVF